MRARDMCPPAAARALIGHPFSNQAIDEMEAGSADAVLAHAKASLATLCADFGINESHGVKHAESVLNHAEQALASDPRLAASQVLAVRLAALLHDADDHKYFGKDSAAMLSNAKRIMEDAGAPSESVVDALDMINLVSCSANGNSCPDRAKDAPWLLWPRWSDRLEAAGEVGVARCFMHNLHVGDPLFTADTPRPTTEDEAFALATEDRFRDYQERGGSSASMIDHYFDKLLQVARPPAALVRNSYLELAASERAAPLVQVVLDFGRRGEVDVEAMEALVQRCGLGKSKRKRAAEA